MLASRHRHGRRSPSVTRWGSGGGSSEWDVGSLPRVVEARQASHAVRAYPALIDEGDSVALRVVTNPELQQRVMRGGVRRLLVLTAGPSAAAVMRHLDQPRRLAVAASGVDIEELAEDCAVAAIDTVLDEHRRAAMGRRSLRGVATDSGGPGSRLASTALVTAADVLAAESHVRLRLTDVVAESARPVVADVEAQLGRLLTPGFVVTVGTARLPDVLRYLRAVEYRLDRLDVAKDLRRLRELAPLERHYDEVRRRSGGGASDDALADIGWQLEELRVSVFAQHLGTAQPVSRDSHPARPRRPRRAPLIHPSVGHHPSAGRRENRGSALGWTQTLGWTATGPPAHA